MQYTSPVARLDKCVWLINLMYEFFGLDYDFIIYLIAKELLYLT